MKFVVLKREEGTMKLLDFMILPERDQLDRIYDDGIYIGKIMMGGKPALLFQLEGFYIEILYSHYRKYIHRINCFATTALLEPYLEQIPIKFLV